MNSFTTLIPAPSAQKERQPRVVRSSAQKMPVGMWSSPAVIAPNNFVFKSLSNWAFNVAVGCSHACRFCYVPSAATIKQGPKLAEYGVEDPDAQWANTFCSDRGTKTSSCPLSGQPRPHPGPI